jgi:hypothetical protein
VPASEARSEPQASEGGWRAAVRAPGPANEWRARERLAGAQKRRADALPARVRTHDQEREERVSEERVIQNGVARHRVLGDRNQRGLRFDRGAQDFPAGGIASGDGIHTGHRVEIVARGRSDPHRALTSRLQWSARRGG